jgi:hypothetical protein
MDIGAKCYGSDWRLERGAVIAVGKAQAQVEGRLAGLEANAMITGIGLAMIVLIRQHHNRNFIGKSVAAGGLAQNDLVEMLAIEALRNPHQPGPFSFS